MRALGAVLFVAILSGCGAGAPAPAAASAAEGASCALPDVDPGSAQRSVAGADLAPCGSTLRTGFYREGRCTTGPDDQQEECSRRTPEAKRRFAARA